MNCLELVQTKDWGRTPIGPRSAWPQSLKTIVDVILHSRHPMFLWWGPELVQIYNDAYVPSFGVGKHPSAMGQRGAECWQEIWPIIWPQIDDVMRRGRASWNEDQLVPIFRNGRIEDVYWTYGYSPVFLESGAIGGTLVVCTETTQRVLSDRRIRTLRELGIRLAGAADPSFAIKATAGLVQEAATDIPFVIFYTSKGGKQRIEHAVGLDDAQISAVDAAVSQACSMQVGSTSDSAELLEISAHGLSAVWMRPKGPSRAAMTSSIVFGVSPRFPFDQTYREFLLQMGDSLFAVQQRLVALRERATTENERRDLLMRAPVAAALLTGPEHRFELANARYEELSGRPVAGMTLHEAFPELVGTALPAIFDRVYQSGEAFVTHELPIPISRADSTGARFFRFNLEPLRDAAGSVYGMMAIAVDITEMVNSRQAMEKAHAEREALLADLESANRAKDEFFAMLGHELRNPLSPIVTALQLMKLRDRDALGREERVIERQVAHLVRLVDDLLDVSKITRGKIELKKSVVDLGDVLGRSVEMASLLLEQRRHVLTIDVPRVGLCCFGDPVRLAQVVANLLTNAARYTPPGGTITLKAHRNKEDLVITVADNGIGISLDVLPNVFDMFLQAKRSSDQPDGGLGLGLTIVKTLVALHGGTVQACSEGLGKGSEFIIRLPARLPAAESATRLPGPVRNPERARRVLVVDDNEDAAELLSQALTRQGHQVESANDPLRALECFAELEPQVVILDIGLPVMDGYELAGRMRALSKRCRFFALTGYGKERDLARSAEAGFERHFVKPVDLEELSNSIVS